LVVFNSFSEFHPRPARLRNRSQQIVQQMIKQFQIDPELVLSNFHAKCYHPEAWVGMLPNPSSRFDPQLLLADLIALDRASLDLTPLKSIPQIVILHGSQDRIVASAQAQELAENLPQSRFIELASAGHALPFTHRDDCWSVLQPVFEMLPV
jgi:pimeloyl-[acyl-carrier protein] methyl ester esterase